MVKKIKTKSDTGENLVVEIGDKSIDAYRVEKPKLRVIGKEKGRAEEKLEEELHKAPVMTIFKNNCDDYSVDFSAGLMRASVFSQTKKDLTEKVDVEMAGGEDIKSNKGWLEWIGLNPKDKRLDSFLCRKNKKLKEVV